MGRRNKSASIWLAVVFVVIGAGYYLIAETSLFDSFSSKTESVELTENNKKNQSDRKEVAGLANPKVQEQRQSQKIEHIGYTIDYNPKWNCPNWVAYCLTKEEALGREGRADHFEPDPLVKGDPVVSKDYSNSGYDRGHMAPAGDFKWNTKAMQESFYMTNMCPQNHNLNSGDWRELEELVRDLAVKYESVYICCGPVMNSSPQMIGKYRKIAVPAAFFKALLRQRKDGKWTSIGFLFPNKEGSKPLHKYAMTIDELQITTGIDFFPDLDDKIEKQTETSFTLSDWNL